MRAHVGSRVHRQITQGPIHVDRSNARIQFSQEIVANIYSGCDC